MTDFQLGNALPNRLPNRRFLPNPVRQFPDVRQIACLTFDLLSTPINKGDRERVRQLGQSETDSQKSEKCGGETSACLTCLTGRNPTPEQPRPSRPPERPHAMTAARYTPRTVADLTAHPDIFGPTYWGGFDMDGNADVITAEVIANRDRLVTGYHVEKLAGIRVDVPSTTGTELDHPEVYALRGGALLLICSNYGDTPPPAALGMFKTFPVYSSSCITYAQTFATARHLKAAIHAAGGEA